MTADDDHPPRPVAVRAVASLDTDGSPIVEAYDARGRRIAVLPGAPADVWEAERLLGEAGIAVGELTLGSSLSSRAGN
jgi:hypothetical protein